MSQMYPTAESRDWYWQGMRTHGRLIMWKVWKRAQSLAESDGSAHVTLAHHRQAWRELLPELANLPGFDDRKQNM